MTNPTTETETPPTFIWIIADASGSMSHLHGTVVAGLNDFIAEQAAEGADAKVTAVQFPRKNGDPGIQTILPMSNVCRARAISGDDYEITGNTPLYDAIGLVIEKADDRLAKRAQQGKPTEAQVVVVFTDGYENASIRFTGESIRQLIEDRKARGWVFVFLGADLDAAEEGGKVGVAAKNTRRFDATADGMLLAMSVASKATVGYRKKSHYERLLSTEAFFDDVDAEITDGDDPV